MARSEVAEGRTRKNASVYVVGLQTRQENLH
jgi:hypothetical protein